MSSKADALAAARQSSASSGAPGTVQQCPNENAWIEIVLQDEDGNPVPDQEYKITTVDGREVTGVLDAKGKARVEGIQPGNCKVTFPLFDKREWKPA